jgi:miniconductance mechanosensitive channel
MQHIRFTPIAALVPLMLAAAALAQGGASASPAESTGGEAAASATAAAAAPSATERAALDLVRALEQTAFGTWLKEHQVAWNAMVVAALLVLGFVLKLVLARVLGAVVARALERANKKRFSDALTASKVIGPISAIAPLLLVARVLGVFGDAALVNPLVSFNVSNLLVALAIVRGIGISSSLMKTVDDVYSSRPEVNRPEALRGYRQVLMVAIGLAGGISAAAVLVGKSPVVFLAALGAATAVLGVVFKDVLFSLVANLLLTANDAIRVGDWIELRAHGVDGRIAEIKTTSVRVQNADGTMHSVPIGRFVQEPYMNYRSKYGSPGRRVRRGIRVDLRTVRALGANELAALAAHAPLAGAAERARTAAGDAPVTNLCVFRAYAERLLASHQAIDPSLPVVVSQQEATATGQPVEILCFIKPDAAPDLASVEGSLLDQLALALPVFALRGYQQGSDLGPITSPLPWLGTADLAAAGVRA